MTSVDTVAKKIATKIVVTKAYDREQRWIWRKSDLTKYDKAEIKKLTSEVFNILLCGRSWDDTLYALRGIATEGFNIGFKEQDKIISICERNGIKFADKR